MSTWQQSGSRAGECGIAPKFRLENGKIVEHWDVVEEIMPGGTWVNSGKF